MRVLIAIAWLIAGFALAQSPSSLPVDIQIPILSTPFSSKGKLHYAYEIHLTNFDRRGRALTLSSVQVLNDRGNQLAGFSGEDLSKRLLQPGLENTADPRRLDAGRRAVLFVWVSVGEEEARPVSFQHRFVISIEGVAGDNTVQCCETTVPRAGLIVIGPPLRGGGWLAGNGPSESNGNHRKALLSVDGRLYLAQRFAIDWIQFGKNGELSSGAENRDFFSYGAEVLAVASGRISGIKDGIPDNKPNSLAVPITLETLAGNYVSLDLGGGRYAHYAHLQPGSLRVKPGDRVREGQVLGLLGNSGNSDAPHLHFHITNGPSAMGSEGIPYSLQSFVEEGQAEEFRLKSLSGAAARRNQLPVDGMVVRFP